LFGNENRKGKQALHQCKASVKLMKSAKWETKNLEEEEEEEENEEEEEVYDIYELT